MPKTSYRALVRLAATAFLILLNSCFLFDSESSQNKSADDSTEKKTGRLVMFVGIDISGSFLKSSVYDNSLEFLANYIFAHLNGFGGLDVPHSLFVGSIGGSKVDEAKTFYPIQTFQFLSIPDIHSKLKSLFPKSKTNPFTDYNSFIKQIAEFVESKNLALRPISVVLLTDGVPDSPRKSDYHGLNLEPLEFLARNITLRVLYTDADVGKNWRTHVKRQRVKIWTQDASVMRDWNLPQLIIPGKPFAEQSRFFAWIKDNVDFAVPIRRVQ
jgi:hypothetical protein